MNKGILIVDIPDNCRVCGCRTVSGFCTGAKQDVYIYGLQNSKPDWCPIKSFPIEEHVDHEYDEYEDGYVDGWNDCSKQILKPVGEKVYE